MEDWTTVLETIDTVQTEWDALATAHGENPFQFSGWFRAWERAFGGSLWALAVRNRGDLRAVLPIQRSRNQLRSPSNSHTPSYGPLSVDATAEKRLVRALFDLDPSCLDLCHIRSDSTFAHTLEREASQRRYAAANELTLQSAYIHTDGDWREYERAIHRRRSVRQHLRQLGDEGSLSVDVHNGTENVDALLDEGFRIEGSGWKTAHGTAINERPERRLFYAEVARWASQQEWLRLTFLRLDDVALAFDFALEYNGTHYVLKTGYNDQFARHGPGSVLRYLTVERAFTDPNIHSYDLLGTAVGSHNEWKRDWATHYRTLSRIRAFAPTIGGSFDHARFRLGAIMGHAKASLGRATGPKLKDRVNRALRFAHRHGPE